MSKYTQQQKHKRCIKYSQGKTTHFLIKKKDKKRRKVTKVSNTFKENAMKVKTSNFFFFQGQSFHL